MAIVYLLGSFGVDFVSFSDHPAFPGQRVRFELNLPGFANDEEKFNWWRLRFSSANPFADLFAADADNNGLADSQQIVEIYRYNNSNILVPYAERVDAAAIQNNAAVLLDVQKQMARHYYFNEVNDSFGEYAASLIYTSNMIGPQESALGANGLLFHGFIKAIGLEVTDVVRSSLLISLAGRDAFLRYNAVIDPENFTISSESIAQYHYDAFEDMGLSVKAWYGTFLQEFVGSGSWASKTFGLHNSATYEDWVKSAADAVVNSFGWNTTTTINGTAYTARDLYHSFYAGLFNEGVFDDAHSVTALQELLIFTAQQLTGKAIAKIAGEIAGLVLDATTGDHDPSSKDYIETLYDELWGDILGFDYSTAGDRDIAAIIQSGVFASIQFHTGEDDVGFQMNYLTTMGSMHAWYTGDLIAKAIADEDYDGPWWNPFSGNKIQDVMSEFVISAHALNESGVGFFMSEMKSELNRQAVPSAKVVLIEKAYTAQMSLYDVGRHIFEDWSKKNPTAGGQDFLNFDTYNSSLTALLNSPKVDFWGSASLETKGYVNYIFGDVTEILVNSLGHYFHKVMASGLASTMGAFGFFPSQQFVEYGGVYTGIASLIEVLEQNSATSFTIDDDESRIHFGSEANDIISYSDTGGYDKLFLGGGNNLVNAASNEDGIYVVVGAGNDIVTGGTGDDIIYAGKGLDTLFGNAGDDTFYTRSGGDIIYGGEGNDVWISDSVYYDTDFIGGEGIDTLAFVLDIKEGHGSAVALFFFGQNIVPYWDSSPPGVLDIEVVKGSEGADSFFLDYFVVPGASTQFPTEQRENAELIYSNTKFIIDARDGVQDFLYLAQDSSYKLLIDPNLDKVVRLKEKDDDDGGYRNTRGGSYINKDNNPGSLIIEKPASPPADKDDDGKSPVAPPTNPEEPSPTDPADGRATNDPDTTVPDKEKEAEEAGNDADMADDLHCPLILDLGAYGITIASVDSDAAVYWDIDNDGFREASAWVGPEDGLLAFDRNGDGIINNHSELFGSDTEGGFQALSVFDSNNDGVIDASDVRFGELRVWIDANGNGETDSGELKTLADLDIVSLSLSYQSANYDIAGNPVTGVGSFTTADNQSHQMIEAWFAYDNVNSYYDMDYEFNLEALFLPTLRGYGALPDLYISMSLNEDLLEMAKAVANATVADVLSLSFDIEGKMLALLYEWAGVTDIAQDVRGGYMTDDRKLEFIEEYLDIDYMQAGSYENPIALAALVLDNVFTDLYNYNTAKFLLQTEMGALLGGAWYNPLIGGVNGFTGLNADMLSDIEDLAGAAASDTEAVYLWQQIVRMVEFTVGTEALSASDIVLLEDAISATTDSESLTQILAQIRAQETNLINGGYLDDSLVGTAGNDVMNGENGDDTLLGGLGTDQLNGGDGDDYLAGGYGNDGLFGGNGNDTYFYEHGQDNIDESGDFPGNIDQILFREGISFEDLTFSRSGVGNLDISIAGAGGITIFNQFDNGTSVERLVFHDGTIFDLSALNRALEGTAGDDLLSGADYAYFADDKIYGYAGNDTISGGIGNDILYGGEGDDTLNGGAANDRLFGDEGDDLLSGDQGDDYLAGGDGADRLNGGAGKDTLLGGAGNDTLDGGAGDDRLEGGDGDDVYLVNETGGYDTIRENFGTDKIVFGAAFNSEEIEYKIINGYDLEISFNGVAVLQIQRHFLSGGSVETIEFADATTVDLSALSFPQFGTNGPDSLVGVTYGASRHDILYGAAGDDYLYGYDGNDTLIGGTGNDFLDGGTGDDVYVVSADGKDTITDYEGNDRIVFEAGLNAEDMAFRRYSGNNLEISFSGSVVANIYNFFVSNYKIETLEFAGTQATLSLAAYENVFGTSSADVLTGNDLEYLKDDLIFGYEGDDTLSGGLGDDTLVGGEGNDTYIYESGIDVVQESGGAADQIVFAEGFDLADMTLERSGPSDLKILFDGLHVLTIENQFSPQGQVEALAFFDNSTFDLASVSYVTEGTANADLIEGISAGGGGDILKGYGGDDYLYGYAGDDTLEGGEGADYLYGGSGDDTYIVSAGMNYIYEASGLDEIVFAQGFDLADMTLERSGLYDLNIKFNGILVVRIAYQFTQNGSIESLSFDDSSTFDLMSVSYVQSGTSSGDTLYGISYGGNPHDTISGGAGNDTIFGFAGNDTLEGGAGDDVVYGGAGDDVYVYTEGMDLYADESGDDRIIFDAGYDQADMTFEKVNSYDLRILFNGIEALTVQGHFNGTGQIETLEFADAGTFDLTNVRFLIEGTAASENIYGSSGTAIIDAIYGYDGNDNIYAAAGDDYLYGGNGDDVLNGEDGDDYLDGGAGNDYLSGGNGADVYVFGEGNDTIIENAGTDVDRILFADGVTRQDITVARYVSTYAYSPNTDLTIADANGNKVVVEGQFSSYASSWVEWLDIGGQQYSLLDMRLATYGTANGDSIYGIEYGASVHDTIYGNAGDDFISAGTGNDTITGGSGSDYMQGGIGNDVYIFSIRDGAFNTYEDEVYEEQDEGLDTIVFDVGILPADVYSWVDGYGTLHLQVGNTANENHIRVYGSSYATGTTDVGARVEKIVFSTGTVWDLANGLNLKDTDIGQGIYGSDLNDTIDGRGGDDVIFGNAGDDTIIGGAGRDEMYGGLGNDTYVFDRTNFSEGGYDYISEELGAGTDTISFVDGILPSEVFIWADGYGDMWIHVAGTDGQIRVDGSSYYTGFTDVGSRIEYITFGNGAVWNLSNGLLMNDTNDGHELHGSGTGDVLDGRGGDDYIYGYAGADTIIGGAGNDYLIGGAGNDKYMFGLNFSSAGGYDVIEEETSDGIDRIFFDMTVNAENVYSWADGYGRYWLQIGEDASGGKLMVNASGYYTDGSDIGSRLEQIVFESGEVWNLSSGTNMKGTNAANDMYGTLDGDTIDGRGGDDYLFGMGGDDTILGGSGNDYIDAGAGADVLIGGAGGDYLYGGDGADTYLFQAATAYDAVDTVAGFNVLEGDVLDISDVLDGIYNPLSDDLADFVQFEVLGNGTSVSIDRDGSGTVYGWDQIALLYNVSHSDPEALVTSGHLLVS